MPDQWSLPELLASEVAMTNRLAFEKEVSSSPLGRRSLALRERAHELVRNDREEEAFKLYEEAASLHAEDDPSPAAAMCWFDLARTYDRRATGVTTANLRNAESLYRRALGSPALALDVHRMGTVRDGLASCLRALAQEPMAQHQEESLLIEATALFEAAVTLALSTGPFGAEDVVSFSHNLGNCLVQRGDLDEALLAFDRAEAYARRFDTLVLPDQRVEHLSRILVHAAQARDLRGRDGDRAHAERALREVLALGHPEWIDVAEMRLAGMLLRDPAVPRESALAQLRKVRVDRIKSKHLDQLVQLYVDAGQRREALVVLHQQIGRAMELWRGAMADNAAAHHAQEAQRLAHVAARLHIEEEDALEAFCTLEDVSGLRFSEEIATFSWSPSSAVARVLRDHHQIRSQIAVMLDDFASRMAHGHADLLGELLAVSASARAEVGDGGDAASQLLHDALEEAAQHSDPVGCLQRSAERIGKESSRLREQLYAIDPSYDARDMPWLFRLTRDVLRGLLLEHPDHALVRISLTSDLFVIAVWLEGDEVVARGRRVATPRGLFRQLEAYAKDVKTASLEPLTAAFAALDLSAVLPARRMAHAVLLPSYLASLLPLGALGPPGKTLLDHFDALSWMPCLTPLFARQSPGRRRAGTVSVAPGGTSHHVLALGVPLSDEVQIEGEQATVERVLDLARSADVMCFYTHGQHVGEHGPEISLHGDHLSEQAIQRDWTGMERVELWACQSGVNLPSDPLTPPVDETFGLDNLFVRRGVRSAIGSLWKVPDLVTACMVRRYRDGLESGLPAPRALANAQRWWRDEGARSLREHLTRMPTAQGLAAFVATLGESVEASMSDAEIASLLGPAPAGGASTSSAIEKSLARLAHPTAWAGFRFVGVAERRPIVPWNEEIQRPLTAEEATRVEGILAGAVSTTETPRHTFDEWLEIALTEATKLAPNAHPSPEQAIKVARLYRDRPVSSSRHNLLAALAWLHEALAVLDWTHKGARRREARQTLSLEAAWLWIDLARGETLIPIELVFVPAPPIALARAQRLLEGLPDDIHTRVARAWLALLTAPHADGRAFEAAVEGAWATVAEATREIEPETYEALRTQTAAWEIALLAPNPISEAVDRCAAIAEEVFKTRPLPVELLPIFTRLRSVVAILASHRSPGIMRGLGGADVLTSRELSRQALRMGMALKDALTSSVPADTKSFNNALDALEGSLWGYPDDDRTPIWASTGTLGGAYRRLAGSLFVGLTMAPEGARDAIKILACLQPLADLRLLVHRRWVQVMRPWENRGALVVWCGIRERELVQEYLEDAAMMFDPKSFATKVPSSPLPPHRLDPFCLSAAEIRKKVGGVIDLIPWQLANSCAWSPGPPPNARTAAFHAVLNIQAQTERVVTAWHTLSEVTAKSSPEPRASRLAALFDPGLRLPVREDMLRRVPPGVVVLGLAIGPDGYLVAASAWNAGDGVEQLAHLTREPVGWLVRQLLADLHQAFVHEGSVADAVALDRLRPWTKLGELLAPVLEIVLGPALRRGPMHVALFAPGALRSLPLLGLRIDGAPLFDRVLDVVHVPALSVEPRVGREGSTEACWLGRARDPDTSFGEAAVETLRRWFDPEIVRAPVTRTRDIPEVEQLDPLAPDLRSLRIYTTTSPLATSPGMSAFNLEGNRGYQSSHMRGVFLPNCEEVELWTATAGSGPRESILRDDRDRIPGLAREFLACGAAGVLDLAWPVFDLVKALVCERFGALRRTAPLDGSAALRQAIADCAALLADWRDAVAGSSEVREALAWLDEGRRRAARAAGRNPAVVAPFTDHVDAPSLQGLPVSALVEEACSPVHLGAFRWWGWLQA